MGRHKKSIERPIMPDVKYNSKVVSKFVCRMMLDGKKETCRKIVYEAMDNLKAKTEKDPLEVMLKAIDNVKPMVEVKSRRVGGATYQVPMEIRESRREALAMRWIIDAARSRSGHGMADTLAIMTYGRSLLSAMPVAMASMIPLRKGTTVDFIFSSA